MRNLLRYGTASVLLAVLAGCGSGSGSGSGDPSPSAASSGAMSDEQILAVGREYAQCMRDHGLNVPEPTVERGRLRVPLPLPPVEGQQQGPPPRPEIPATCQSIVDRLPREVMSRAPMTADDVQKIERFSQCVRENGIPGWPGPKPDGTIPLNGTSIDIKSDAFLNAKRACQKYYDGPLEESTG
jgi:hypothetical protein